MQNDQSSLKLWLIGKYLDLFNLYKESEVYRHNIVEAKSRLLNIERMKDEGMVTNNDVLRSQLAVSNYELAYNETQNNILLVSQQLDIVLGMNEDSILQPDMNLFDTKIDVNAESDYLNQSYTQYPLLKMAKTNIDIAQNNLDLAKSTYLPKLSLQAGNTFARPIPYVVPSEDLYINSWGLSLSLSFNISSYFSKKDNLNQAKRQINLSQLALEQQKQAVRTELKSAYIKHREALDRIKILEKSLDQSTENYRIVKNKYFNRLSILTDLLDANAVLLESELQLTEARTNAIYTYYQLQEISGNL
jgi:outer membrane protein TolC